LLPRSILVIQKNNRKPTESIHFGARKSDGKTSDFEPGFRGLLINNLCTDFSRFFFILKNCINRPRRLSFRFFPLFLPLAEWLMIHYGVWAVITKRTIYRIFFQNENWKNISGPFLPLLWFSNGNESKENNGGEVLLECFLISWYFSYSLRERKAHSCEYFEPIGAYNRIIQFFLPKSIKAYDQPHVGRFTRGIKSVSVLKHMKTFDTSSMAHRDQYAIFFSIFCCATDNIW
jgi:hypothetical protein